MKRIVLILLLSGCATVPHCDTIEQAQTMIKPGDVKGLEWLFSNQIKYWRDYTFDDEYRDTNQTLKYGYGDCDDYFQIAYEIVNSWPGWLATKNLKKVKDQNHVTAMVYGPDGQMGEFDNGVYHKWSTITQGQIDGVQ